MRRALLTLFCFMLAASCATPVPATPAPMLIPYADPPRITGLQPSPCTAEAGGALPDPVCTPGAVGTTDRDVVCASGFQEAHRVNSSRARARAMQAYGVPVTETGTVEYDHLVPLSLGGANATSNLWPQRSDLTGQGVRNSKDAIETTLWRAVCKTRTVQLVDAQRAFATDWRTALSQLRVVVTRFNP